MWRKEKLELEQHCLQIKNQRRLSRIRAAAGLKGRRAVVLRRMRQAVEDVRRGYLTVKPAKNPDSRNLAEALIRYIAERLGEDELDEGKTSDEKVCPVCESLHRAAVEYDWLTGVPIPLLSWRYQIETGHLRTHLKYDVSETLKSVRTEILSQVAEWVFSALIHIGDRTPAMVHTMKDVQRLVNTLVRFARNRRQIGRTGQ